MTRASEPGSRRAIVAMSEPHSSRAPSTTAGRTSWRSSEALIVRPRSATTSASRRRRSASSNRRAFWSASAASSAKPERTSSSSGAKTRPGPSATARAPRISSRDTSGTLTTAPWPSSAPSRRSQSGIVTPASWLTALGDVADDHQQPGLSRGPIGQRQEAGLVTANDALAAVGGTRGQRELDRRGRRRAERVARRSLEGRRELGREGVAERRADHRFGRYVKARPLAGLVGKEGQVGIEPEVQGGKGTEDR